MLAALFRSANEKVNSAGTASEYCYGRLELPGTPSWSPPAGSHPHEDSPAEYEPAELHHAGAVVHLPPMRTELAHGVKQQRDYGGGVIGSVIVATIGLALLILLLF